MHEKGLISSDAAVRILEAIYAGASWESTSSAKQNSHMEPCEVDVEQALEDDTMLNSRHGEDIANVLDKATYGALLVAYEKLPNESELISELFKKAYDTIEKSSMRAHARKQDLMCIGMGCDRSVYVAK